MSSCLHIMGSVFVACVLVVVEANYGNDVGLSFGVAD